ncbi:hypothetical protein M758_9G085300 [Ceratodon purpureus]|nr:hypothetical protein M758_9G085300 [Ceratodon purpureus]
MEGALVFLRKTLKDHADLSAQQKADCYSLMRYIYRFTGQPEDALEMHKLCVEHGGSEIDTIGHGLMMAEQDKGGAYSYLQNLLDQQNTNHHVKRDAYNSMGLVLAQERRFQEAQEHHIKALKLALSNRCPNAAMLTYFYLGQVEHRAAIDSHKSPLSEKYYKKGQALAEKLKARVTAVSLHNNGAEAVLRDEKLQRIRDLFLYRQELAQQDPIKIAEALVLLNNAYLSILHNPQLILESVQQALDLLSKLTINLDVVKLSARCFSHRGLAYFRLEETKNADSSFDASIALFKDLEETNEVIEMYYFKACLNIRLGDKKQLPQFKNDLEKALGLLKESMGLLPSKRQQNLMARGHYLLMSIALDEGEEQEAMTHFSQCKEAAEESFDAEVLIKAHIVMADVHQALLWRYRTYKMFTQANPEGCIVEGSVATLQLPVPMPVSNKAVEDAHMAHLELARRRGSPIMLAHSLSAVGEYYKSRKKFGDALFYLEEAALLEANLLFSIEQIAGGSLEFMRITRKTYFNLLSCIAALDDPAVREEGLVWAERLRTRTLMRAMDLNFKEDPLIEIRNFDRDKHGALRTLKDLSISCQGIVFVEYALTNTEILIWVVKSGSIVLRTLSFKRFYGLALANLNQNRDIWDLPLALREKKKQLLQDTNLRINLTRNGILALIKLTVEYIKQSFRTDEYLRFLGKFLLDPISEDLADVTGDQCIVFIPHEELACVPFAALQLKDNEYLIKHYNVAVSMSMRAYAYCERRYAESKIQQTDLRNMLIVSNPFPVDSRKSMGLPSSEYKRLEPLREAELEAQTIKKCIQAKAEAVHVHHLRGRHAHKVAVMKELRKADWVHFACHGFVSEKYPQGALLLGQTVGSFWLKCLVAVITFFCWLFGARLPSFVYEKAADQASYGTGILGAEEVLKCGMQARCVVLNACNSAQGKVTADGLFNWSHILQQVQVPSAVLCHWEVEDSAGRKFMRILYHHLSDMVPLGMALRKTMVAMIRDGENGEPKHWASYSLVGVPHVQLLPGRNLENQAGQLPVMNIAQEQATLRQADGNEEEGGDGIPGSSSTGPDSDSDATSEESEDYPEEWNLFKILGLKPGCSKAEIEAAYRKKSLELLPLVQQVEGA